jgi:hypothetical protein
VVIALDNDFVKSPDQKKLKELKSRELKIKQAVERLEKNGKQVSLIIPNESKTDFNDTLKDKGFTDLSKQLNQFITDKDYKKMTETYVNNANNNIHSDMKKEIETHKNNIKITNDAQNNNTSNDRLSMPKSPTIDASKIQNSKEILQHKSDLQAQNKKLDTIKQGIDRNLKEQVKYDQVENIAPPEATKNRDVEKQLER